MALVLVTVVKPVELVMSVSIVEELVETLSDVRLDEAEVTKVVEAVANELNTVVGD